MSSDFLLRSPHIRSPSTSKPRPPLIGSHSGLTEELGMRPLTAQCHLGLGLLGRRAGQHQLAERHSTVVSALFREMGILHWLKEAEAAMAH
jgi:hypothetical protein